VPVCCQPVLIWRNSTPRLLGITAGATADDDDVSPSSFDVDDQRQPQPQLPRPPRIERRGAKPGRIVSDETRSKMSRAKEGRVMPLGEFFSMALLFSFDFLLPTFLCFLSSDSRKNPNPPPKKTLSETRLKISVSRKGTVLSNATKERMAEVRRRWWASKRKAKKLALKRGLVLEAAAATTTKATTATTRGKKKEEQVQELDALSSDDDDEDLDSDDDKDEEDDDFSLDPSSSLDLERAVAELSSLRAEVSAWISAFAAASGGRTPTRADAERSPQVYRKFIRFIALQDFVRSARGGGGGGGGTGGGGGKR